MLKCFLQVTALTRTGNCLKVPPSAPLLPERERERVKPPRPEAGMPEGCYNPQCSRTRDASSSRCPLLQRPNKDLEGKLDGAVICVQDMSEIKMLAGAACAILLCQAAKLLRTLGRLVDSFSGSAAHDGAEHLSGALSATGMALLLNRSEHILDTAILVLCYGLKGSASTRSARLLSGRRRWRCLLGFRNPDRMLHSLGCTELERNQSPAPRTTFDR